MKNTAKREYGVLGTDWRGDRRDSSLRSHVCGYNSKSLHPQTFLISHGVTIFGLQHNVDGAPLSCVVRNTCNKYETCLQHPQLQQSFHSRSVCSLNHRPVLSEIFH